MDNTEFVNMYVEKLIGTITELNKRLLLLETQFEYNTNAAVANLKELEEIKIEFSKYKETHISEIEQKNRSIHTLTLELEYLKKEQLSVEAPVKKKK